MENDKIGWECPYAEDLARCSIRREKFSEQATKKMSLTEHFTMLHEHTISLATYYYQCILLHGTN